MAANRDPRHADDGTASSRLGLSLFWIYVALYGGFMALVLVRPDLLSRRPFGGVNLAILYGMGLIVAAFVLAVVYMLLRAGHREGPRA
jgi:uncharacterized membrane protein (DUF485 family)